MTKEPKRHSMCIDCRLSMLDCGECPHRPSEPWYVPIVFFVALMLCAAVVFMYGRLFSQWANS